jgi:uncharacterized metal-binding protein YceD (DUF177 family)
MMSEAIEPAPFSRVMQLRALTTPKPFAVAATAAEAAAVAALFAVEAIDDLRVAGTLEPGAERWRLRGAAEARVTQLCVVTAVPVTVDVVAPFDRYLVVDRAAPPDPSVAVDPDDEDVDYLDHPEIDIGAVALEELALNLDPYPRAPDADAALAALQADDRDEHPFAALARRRAGS